MDSFLRLARSLRRSGVRFAVIGLSGINLHARSASEVFATQDRDLFVPLDPDNALAAWRASERLGLELECGREPLDRPRDRLLAERVIASRVLVPATDHAGLDVDFTLVMAGFDFDTGVERAADIPRRGRGDPGGTPRLHHRIEAPRRPREGPLVLRGTRRGGPRSSSVGAR